MHEVLKTYMLILTLVSGVAANGAVGVRAEDDRDRDDRDRPGGSACSRGGVVVLLGETLRGGQFVGIAIALSGLLVFIVINQRGEQRRMKELVPPMAN